MYHGVAAAHSLPDRHRITDVAFREPIVGDGPDRFQVGQISCVGELVKIHYAVSLAKRKHVADEVRADKAGSAGDQYVHRANSWKEYSPAQHAQRVILLAPASATRLLARSSLNETVSGSIRFGQCLARIDRVRTG